VAVRVYVVETAGLTTLLPDNVWESMLGVIEIEVVLEVDQVRMVDEPAVIVLGEAEICPVGKVEEGGGGGGGGGTKVLLSAILDTCQLKSPRFEGVPPLAFTFKAKQALGGIVIDVRGKLELF
jgi:hypothetical protein